MRHALIVIGLIVGMLLVSAPLRADETVMPTAQLQQRYNDLTHELRCMTCQNQSIADSPVGLATDLRRDVRELLIAGKTDQEVRDWMVARYGTFILFRPPFNARAGWVWVAPPLLLLLGGFAAWRIVRQRSAMVANDNSEIETDEPR